MGQCQYCRRVKDDPAHVTADGSPLQEECGAKNSDSDSALDSDQSGDEASCSGVHGGLRLTRSGRSSQSSGKYSLRESFSSCGDFDRHEFPCASANDDDDDGDALGVSSVFDDRKHGASAEEIREGHLHPLQDVGKWRKLSRCSNESERGSMTSMSSLTSELRAKLGRSISLKLQTSNPRINGFSSPSWKRSMSPKKPRSVSLRLPRKQKRPRNFRNKLPTIYVDDTEVPQENKQKISRKMSLRRTFSMLNVSSLSRQDSQPESKQQQQKLQKPVQKILRQPRRRHNTVRGISGMAIDGSNRTGIHSTRYYPTNTSLRVATPANVLYL